MKKVLVADDTKNIRILLTTCLESDGYIVITAKNGEEALDILKKGDVDLAFIDIKMPLLSGTEVLREIRSNGITTPVIIITAFATIKNAIECTKLGAVEYIQKPFTVKRVKAVLEKMLNEQKKLDENNINTLIDEVENLIDNNNFNDALDRLKKFNINPNDPRLYLLYHKIYNGLGNKEMSDKFLRAYKIFNEN
ncbi:response regulator receiver protein [Thermoanaerobacterium thermosaccharolyticum DSM 571]|uniref:Stage 0 sporulation protein A homolog n=1 Tax=Thermoanaerobacterium thermosaccharolyticum (strain ATCC 7956 / DSM 571 / NCIMB 9385 / NCA 3814 / NCTC 13789 / WDCM 00135 / 2032) TaxID=580327 RepID=D9TLV8_THETC|nr:response regulator [Thermoanaerobacterium thermosaccharolyticum]ADL69456.1 response regulator receiver protein [Thermoanaerobacterium thermosaccharolyticum DSM 571]